MMHRAPLKSLMKPAGLTLRPGDSVGRAMSALLASGHSSAAVVDDGGRPVGVLSISDILGSGRGSTAGDRMTSPAVTVVEDAESSVAARLMLELGLVQLPVVDRKGHLVGTTTALDLLGAMVAADKVYSAA